MSTWYYYDSNGQKQGPITGGQLKGLAKAGRIVPETVVETENGKVAPARKVKGLTFVEAVNTITAAPPATEPSPFSATPETANPFIASAQPVNQTMPQDESVPVAGKSKKSAWIAVLVILVLIGVKGAMITDRSGGKEEQAEIDKFIAVFGNDVKKKFEGGWTLLHTAASNEGVAVVKFLISESADVNIKTDDGTTPLIAAVVHNNVEVAKFLVSVGADVNIKDEAGITPLHAAAYCGNVELAKLFVSKGANVNASGNDGGTPLVVAETMKNTAMIQYLESVGGKQQVAQSNPSVITQQQRNAAMRQEPIETVSAVDLLRLYNHNEVLADETCKSKRIIVHGIIAEIGKDYDGQPYIKFEIPIDWNNSTNKRIVICFFSQKDVASLASLRKGQTAYIEGTCIGSNGISKVELGDCSVR